MKVPAILEKSQNYVYSSSIAMIDGEAHFLVLSVSFLLNTHMRITYNSLELLQQHHRERTLSHVYSQTPLGTSHKSSKRVLHREMTENLKLDRSKYDVQ